jgi:hypothetical protein
MDVARLVASVLGFSLELEPMAGHSKVTATHNRTGAVIRANGTSDTDAADNIIKLLTEGAA